MELLTTTLVIVFLTTASTKPISRHRHYDADIIDNDWLKESLDRNKWWSAESSSFEDFSSESDQSRASSESSESQSSEESSEEVLILDQTTPVMTTTTMTAIITGGGNTLTPEPDTMSTDEPNVTVTPASTTPSPSVVTSSSAVTHCVTEEIPTAAPITENRGDN